MPLIKDFGSFKIRIHPGDHNPPHVHVVGPEFETLIKIADGNAFKGDVLPKPVAVKVEKFIAGQRDFLTAEWERASGRRPLK